MERESHSCASSSPHTEPTVSSLSHVLPMKRVGVLCKSLPMEHMHSSMTLLDRHRELMPALRMLLFFRIPSRGEGCSLWSFKKTHLSTTTMGRRRLYESSSGDCESYRDDARGLKKDQLSDRRITFLLVDLLAR